MSEFKPGLEGVVAFETEIAEPDRDGGALRYRGIDIEELVGTVPFEKVWGVLVDESTEPGLPAAEDYVAPDLTGRTPSDLQTVTSRLGAEWGLGQLIDVSDGDAKEDLRRLSATMISVCAQSARLADGHADRIASGVVSAGETTAERFLLEWRGAAEPAHVRAIDTYWICTAEHGLNASTFTARIVASTGADCAAALSSAVGALSGPLHGGAPARVLPMLDEAAAAPSVDGYVKDLLDRGERLMGFGHRVYRAEDPTRAPPASNRAGARLAEVRGRGGARAGGARRAACAEARPCARNERRVLVRGRARRRRGSAAARSRHVRVLAHGRLVGAHPRAEAPRQARASVGALRRARRAVAVRGVMQLAEAATRAEALARSAGSERELAMLRADWDDEIEAAARDADYRVRGLAYRAIGQFRFRQKLELLRRGLEDESAGARGSALIALRALSADHPGDVNSFRPLLNELAMRDPNDAVRRLAILCLENGTADRGTIQLLDGIVGDDETDRDVRETARKVSVALVRKSRTK